MPITGILVYRQMILLDDNFAVTGSSRQQSEIDWNFRMMALLSAVGAGQSGDNFSLGVTDRPEMLFTALPKVQARCPKSPLRIAAFAAGSDHQYDLLNRFIASGFGLEILQIDSYGRFDEWELEKAASCAILSIPIADAATGLILPFAEICASVSSSSKAIIHIEATAAPGNAKISLESCPFDVVTLAGPVPGRDLVLIRKGSRLAKAFARAVVPIDIPPLDKSIETLDESIDRRRKLRDNFESSLLQTLDGIRLFFADSKRLVNTSAASISGTNSESLAALLEIRGLRAVPLSLCARLPKAPLPIFAATDVPFAETIGAIHFSFGYDVQAAELATARRIIADSVNHLRRIGI